MKYSKKLIYAVILLFAVIACDKDDDTTVDLGSPSADFNYTPSRPIEGEEVLFYADPENESAEIVEWHWNFGDSENATSDKRNPYFTFDSAGEYEVILRVKNAAGNSMERARMVNVLPPPPDEYPASIAWVFSNNTAVGNINEGSNSPAIGDDGTIYYVEGNAGGDSKVVAVTDAGENAELKWATSIENQVSNAPSIGPQGDIFINSWGAARSINRLAATDGSIIWSGNIGTGVSNNTPAVDSRGNIYHGSRAQGANGGAFSWDENGDKRWEITGVGAFYAAPVISADEETVYYLNTNNGEIWAINAEDGSQKWESPVGLGSGIHGSSLSVDADGTIYFTTNTHVVAVTDNGDTGEVKWQTEVNDAANSGVVIGPEGDLYTGSRGGLLALSPNNGEIDWTFEIDIVESVPAVDMHGNIYVGSSDGNLYIVNSAGEQIKVLELGDNVVNSPTIADDGSVFVEAMDGSYIKLYKITVENSGPADSPWPMKGQNVKNTGVAR